MKVPRFRLRILMIAVAGVALAVGSFSRLAEMKRLSANDHRRFINDSWIAWTERQSAIQRRSLGSLSGVTDE